MAALVRLESVTKSYPSARGESVTAVDGIDLEVEAGEVFGIIGYSGAGKSTLVRLVNALERPTAGRVIVGERDFTALGERELRKERQEIGMIFQQFNLFRSRTVAGNVGYPLRVAGAPKAARKSRVAELLDFVGLGSRADAHPEQLSGGQKQRVGIARALANNPKLLLADEATSALDPDTTADVLALLRRVNRELGVTVVLITHEMDAITSIADRVAVMESGRIVERGTVYEVFSHPQTPAAERFVRTVLHDRPTGSTLERLRRRHPGRLITVRVPPQPGVQGVVARELVAAGVDGEIVFGGIDELQERPIGSLSYALTGPDAAIDTALTALRARGLELVEE